MLRRVSRLAFALLVLAVPGRLVGQEGPLKVEPLKEAPPSDLADKVREALQESGVRVLDGQGKPFADIWLRKAVPASGKPAGPKGAILYPVLSDGELVGALRFAQEGHDYRDQAIAPGVFTLRYGLQPVDGDHLGVSTYRDYLLLVPAAKDPSPDRLARKALETRSAEAAGFNHPAVLILLAPPAGVSSPGVTHDEEKNLWGVVLTLPLGVAEESGATPLPVQLILVGAAPV
jgi:hypothetical protein